MEFNDKLQQLRKQGNMTQEELAEALYVSRTARNNKKYEIKRRLSYSRGAEYI